LIGEKVPLIRQVANFVSNPLIRRHIIGDAAVVLVLKSRFSLFLGRRGAAGDVVFGSCEWCRPTRKPKLNP
jgi:hypothetical protein